MQNMQTTEKIPKLEIQEWVDQPVDGGKEVNMNGVDEAVDIIQQIINCLTTK